LRFAYESTVMPPLRAESILTLAAVQDEELAQSYERSRVFAGKLAQGQDAGRDWAPIYLSDALVDTEIGSLLNMTDQMLKSWSQAGQIEYVNFNYSKPNIFPFGVRPLNELVFGDEILFNWNTSGLGSAVEFGPIRVFALNRTGSLPITYGSDAIVLGRVDIGALGIFEEQAYDYFSGLRDLYLSRVVQYTALYQAFRAFPVTVTETAVASWPLADIVAAALAKAGEDILWQMMDIVEADNKDEIEAAGPADGNDEIHPRVRDAAERLLSSTTSSVMIL
jgi:hypothetical protein